MQGKLNTALKEAPPVRVFDSDVYLVKDESSLKRFSLADPADVCRLLVLLRDPDHETCAPADLELLNKIADWKDLKLKRSEVMVVNLARQETSLIELNKNIHASNIIGFGITPAEIGFHIHHPPNALITFRKVNFIFTASLKELTADDKMKNKFFREALRPMFQ
jgi:hypothetical protein